MTQTLSFIANGKEMKFVIEGKVVRYFDEFWEKGIQLYPMDRLLVKQLALSRSERMRKYADNIAEANQGENLKEYESAQTEEDLREIIIKDAKKNGLTRVY